MSRQLAWFILGFALIAAVAMQSVAHGWELETEVTKNHYAQDEKWNVLDAYGFKVKVTDVDKFVYGFASYDSGAIRLTGIGRPNDFNIIGVGMGFKAPVTKWLTLFAETGYFMPTIKYEYIDGHGPGGDWEGYHGFINSIHSVWGGPHSWDWYDHKLKSNFGGSIGAKIHHQITEHFSIGVVYTYTMLRLEEIIGAHKDEWTGGWWEYRTERDFSSHNIGFSLTYNF